MLKVFVTNLGKYNEGQLIGEWLNLPADKIAIKRLKERIEIGRYYEEIFITDYETDIDGLKVGEYDNLNELNEMAETLNDLDESDREIIEAIMSEGYSLTEAIEMKDDVLMYYDVYDMTDVAYQYVDECGFLNNEPDFLRNYFDYEAYGRDMALEGTFIFTNNGNCVQIIR